MAWYDSAVFYHIHPLSLCGCEHESRDAEGSHFDKLAEWAGHAKKMGCNAIYIGPVFQAETQGYGITDYYKIDSRLGTNEEFRQWVALCHDMGMRIIVDAVFNHVGRSFFAFQHLRKHGKKSAYKEWFSNLNFSGDNAYGDGFRYENWGGYMRLVKLNILSPWLHDYHFDTVKYWIHEFDIDGLRIDAIDELDYDFIKELRKVTDSAKPDFWLMGEIDGQDYAKWVNDRMLHSAANNLLQKGLIIACNDNELPVAAYLMRRVDEQCPYVKLYIFVDNRDVSHIYEKLNRPEHQYMITLLQYTAYGIPSLYCGSEFSTSRMKTADDMAGCLELADYKYSYIWDEITCLHCLLGRANQQFPELSFGFYQQLLLTQQQFAFGRVLRKSALITAVNREDEPVKLEIPLPIAASHAVNVLDARIEWEKEPAKSLDLSGCKELEIRENMLAVEIPAGRGCLFRVTV